MALSGQSGMAPSPAKTPHAELWFSADGKGPDRRDPVGMRILVALGGSALQRRNVEQAAAALAALTVEHELIVTHDSVPRIGHLLELALRNRLPERDVVSVLTQVVVNDEDPEPNAITEVRSLRVLVDSGALVICAGGGIPIALDGDGTMHEVETAIDKDLTAALLARRLDADLLLTLTDMARMAQGEAGTQLVTTTAAGATTTAARRVPRR
jgi:carbamate kinase